MAKSLHPLLYVLSDYSGMDTGSPGGYDPSFRVFLPDISLNKEFDRNKVLESLTLSYESLSEVPIDVSVFRQANLGEPGTLIETVSSSVGTEPSAVWGSSWALKSYAEMALHIAKFSFVKAQGRYFGVGIKADADLTPFRLVEATFRFHTERQPSKGHGVYV